MILENCVFASLTGTRLILHQMSSMQLKRCKELNGEDGGTEEWT